MSVWIPVLKTDVTHNMLCCAAHSSTETCIQSNDGKKAYLRFDDMIPPELDGYTQLDEQRVRSDCQEGGDCYILENPTNEELKNLSDDQIRHLGFDDDKIDELRNA